MVIDHSSSDQPQNGVTLKKTVSGYTWTIACAANENTEEALWAAYQRAKAIDARIRAEQDEAADMPVPRASRKRSK